MYGCRGWDELERYGAGKRGRGRVRGGSPLPASASARDNTGQGVQGGEFVVTVKVFYRYRTVLAAVREIF